MISQSALLPARTKICAYLGRSVSAGLDMNKNALYLACLVLSAGIAIHADDSDWNWLGWKIPGKLEGRLETAYPSPRCCSADNCLAKDQGRYAVVTSVRSPEYLVLFKELLCSVQRHLPGVKVIVVGVKGDLDARTVAEIKTLAEYRIVKVPSFDARIKKFALNWWKALPWGFTEFDAILMLDADTVVLSNLMHLFALPTDFAWATFQAPGFDINVGGLTFLRPCKPVLAHMLDLLTADPDLRFQDHFAEQSFFEWYFKYTGLRLPMEYNAAFFALEKCGGTTCGGIRPKVVHFAYGPRGKPMNITSADPEWQFMCHRPKQRKSVHFGLQAGIES